MKLIQKITPLLSLTVVLAGTYLNVTAQTIEKPNRNNTATTFAIVVDQETFSKTKTEISAYKAALEAQGLGTYVISHQWSKPEEIKVILEKLYAQKPRLEGAVLIGAIPIPFIANAQRLTSAYKLDEGKVGLRAAVPSDRFYDDFHLKFKFIKRDSVKKNNFYYTLDPSSDPIISMNIYTARIKAPVIKGQDQYAQIKAYLTKVVKEKKEVNKLNTMMVYSGIGYASESQAAWASEQVALREQLPCLFKAGASAKFINSRMQGDIKAGLFAEIQRQDLDIAAFHQHGESDLQMISGYPNASFPQPSIENVKRYLRNKLQMASRKKQDIEETKKRFQKSLGVPMEWMQDALQDSVIKADSLFEASGNIVMEEIDKVEPNARMVILDNCYNGSFHRDDYMAGHYVFGRGKTVVAFANSINVLQDVWTTEMIGLLQYGVRAGNWFKQQAYLETHLIGDPTFAFSAEGNVDYNAAIVNADGLDGIWKKCLQSNDADLQALALSKIFAVEGKRSSSLLKQTYYNSPYASTRMQAWKLLSRLNNADFAAVLKDGASDPYEYIRRRSVNTMGDYGSNDMVPALVMSAVADWYSKRVSYNSGNSLTFMDAPVVIAELEKLRRLPQFAGVKEADFDKLIEKQKASGMKVEKERNVLEDKKGPAKERKFNVNMLRTYTYHKLVPQAIHIALDQTEDKELRVAAVEALGWFPYSYQKQEILKMCTELINNKESSENLKDEALRTQTYLLSFTSKS